LAPEKSHAFLMSFMVVLAPVPFLFQLALLIADVHAEGFYSWFHSSRAPMDLVVTGVALTIPFLMIGLILFSRSMAQLQRGKSIMMRFYAAGMGLLIFGTTMMYAVREHGFIFLEFLGKMFYNAAVLHASHIWSIIGLLNLLLGGRLVFGR